MLKQLNQKERLAKFTRGWQSGLPETPCGSGSKLSNTKAQREWLAYMAQRYAIGSIADIGAGDQNWIKKLEWDVRYTAYDLIPRSADVVAFDLVNEIPPRADAVLCLWVINHMPHRDQKKAIANLLKSDSKYLFITDQYDWGHTRSLEPIEMLELDTETHIKMVELG